MSKLQRTDTLAGMPGYMLRRATNAMMDELGSRLAEINMRVSDASVMLLIDARQSMTSSEIGKVLDIQRANMVPLLTRLESTGLIERKPIDRKSLAILLTPVGLDKLSKVKSITQRFEQDLIARIPAEHRDHFVPALHALLG